MTADELIRHTFPWEIAPGVPGEPAHEPAEPRKAALEAQDAAA
jgi:hypothetical protein